MFTGIVAAVGRITSVTPLGQGEQEGLRLRVEGAELGLGDVAIGDSIAIQGACMTVVALQGSAFEVEVSRESLRCTAGLDREGPVNLEKALRLQDRLGGHLVSGHVDGLAHVSSLTQVGESFRLEVLVPASLARYVAVKGSAVINGVSLTVNQVVDVAQGCLASFNLIPHTMAVTTLSSLKAGDAVNFEVDLIARYCERLLARDEAGRQA